MTAIHWQPGDAPTGDRFRFVVPSFGPGCVCCSADAQGRTQQFNPSTNGLRAPSVSVPVCQACAGHALARSYAANRVGVLLALGIGVSALGLYYLFDSGGPSRDPAVAWSLVGGGGALAAAAVGWGLVQSALQRSERKPGHHPRMDFQVHPGLTVLFTDNETLAAELLARNPSARRGPPQERAPGEPVPPAFPAQGARAVFHLVSSRGLALRFVP